MSFNSVIFLLCLPIVVALYYILPKKFRWVMLLIASYAFYMSWNPWLIFLIMFTTLVSYFAGRIMSRSQSGKIKKTCLIVTLICCLGVLFFFKYFTFAVNTVIDIINLSDRKLPEFTLSLILPVGISFYTFQTLSYVIDVYKGRIEAEKHIGYFALYVVYFPQLVAGPIERPENLIPQLKEVHSFDFNDFSDGLRIALVGYVKKIVIADGVAAYVNNVYNNVASASGLTVIIATVLFAIQIYCDFSGYTDIAIGVARMMGIKLMDNFNQPYLATSIKDFWHRWHISLTSWFTDYVYIPLGGNRCKLWRWMLNVMIVFLLSGLWHGAALTFIVWGGIHGVYQIVGRLKNDLLKRLEQRGKIKVPNNSTMTWIKRGITFALVCFAWIFFRGNSLIDCGILISKIFTDWSGLEKSLQVMGLDIVVVMKIFLMCGLLALSHKIINFEIKSESKFSAVVSHKITYIFFILLTAIAWFALMASGGESAFIYFQF